MSQSTTELVECRHKDNCRTQAMMHKNLKRHYESIHHEHYQKENVPFIWRNTLYEGPLKKRKLNQQPLQETSRSGNGGNGNNTSNYSQNTKSKRGFFKTSKYTRNGYDTTHTMNPRTHHHHTETLGGISSSGLIVSKIRQWIVQLTHEIKMFIQSCFADLKEWIKAIFVQSVTDLRDDLDVVKQQTIALTSLVTEQRKKIHSINDLIATYPWLLCHPIVTKQGKYGILFCNMCCVSETDELLKGSSFCKGYLVNLFETGPKLWKITTAVKKHAVGPEHKNHYKNISAKNVNIMSNLMLIGYSNIYWGYSDSSYENRVALYSKFGVRIGNRHHGRKVVRQMKHMFFERTKKKMHQEFTTINTATLHPPFFGVSQDGISQSGTTMEIILARAKFKGVMQIVPLKVDWIRWRHDLDTGSAKSRIAALQNALEHELLLPMVHSSTYLMGANWDGKYIKSGCPDVLKDTFKMKRIQWSMWDMAHLLELVHKDVMKDMDLLWYLHGLKLFNCLKTRFGYGKQQSILKQESAKQNIKFLALVRYVITRFIAYLHRSIERYEHNYKCMRDILATSSTHDDKELLLRMRSLENVVDGLIIRDVAENFRKKSERHQSTYAFPWEYCRTEDEMKAWMQHRINDMKDADYSDIKSVDDHWLDLLQSTFHGRPISLDNEYDDTFNLFEQYQDEFNLEWNTNTGNTDVSQGKVRRSQRNCNHKQLMKLSVDIGTKLCDGTKCVNQTILTDYTWHCINGCDFDLCDLCCQSEEKTYQMEMQCDQRDDEMNCQERIQLRIAGYSAKYVLMYEKILLYFTTRINVNRDYPILRIMYDCLDLERILAMARAIIKQKTTVKVYETWGVNEVKRLVAYYNELENIEWNVIAVERQYKIYKSRVLHRFLSGRFTRLYIKNKSKMSRGWRVEHEIVRQFDLDSMLFKQIPDMLALYDASYAHMAAEIDCESVGKAMKSRIQGRYGLSRYELNKEIIISYNGPPVWSADPLMNVCADEWLTKHKLPVIWQSKFHVGQVVDRLNECPAKFDWFYI